MLVKPSIEELLPQVENRYVLTLLTAKRARQLVDGAKPMSDRQADNDVTLAAYELSEFQLKDVRGRHEITVPLRPEIMAKRLEAEALERQKREEAMQEDGQQLHIPETFRRVGEEEAGRRVERESGGLEFAQQLVREIERNAREGVIESEE